MKHLRTRVLIQILIPTLAIFLAISVGVYLFYLDSYKDSVTERKQAEFLNVSRLFSDWISGRVRELMLISASDQLTGGDIKQTRDYLKSALSKQTYGFVDFWIIDKTGRYWNTAEKEGFLPAGEDLELLFRGEKLFLYLIPQDYQNHADKAFVLFGLPVISRSGVQTILSGSINLSELNRLLNLYTYKMFDSAALIDLNTTRLHTSGGRIIAHSDASKNGKTELELFGGDISTNRYGKSESFFVTSLINNWKFIGRITNTNLYFQLDVLSKFFILILILLLCVITVLSIGISQQISNPVLSLTQGVNRMLQGDFTNKISVKTNDELSSLADAFNLLNKRNIQLRTNDRFSFLGRISSRMAHEIRHPLHVIQIAVETINRENYGKNRDIITQEINKAEMFIREVLEIAKPRDLSLKPYSMSKLAENIHKKYILMNNEHGIQLELKFEAEYDTFYFDVLKIEQVITNILNNSFEATPANGHIVLSVENSSDGCVIVRIADTGPGYDLKNLDRVFDPYYTTKENGTGLGLSICYQILAAHGANIELCNSPGGGAETKIVFTSVPGK